MLYYILLPGDTEQDTIKDANQLGHISFKHFHPNDGFKVLKKLINQNRHDILNDTKLIDQQGKQYTIEEFLDIVEKH